MGLFEPERTNSAPHPRKEPRFPEPLSRENLKKVFQGCADYMERTVYLHGDRSRTVTVCYLLGMTRNERLSDYVLRPLAQDPASSARRRRRSCFPCSSTGPSTTWRPTGGPPWTRW